ncbi:two-component system sensor histidine kinase NtrB [Oleispirillum naphthae]|uniref:two-component system sensor histidine kinase NtrB n=1 Tax=Oleispirillum naphthae TaxID=2838853 RepID=UPI003B66BC04
MFSKFHAAKPAKSGKGPAVRPLSPDEVFSLLYALPEAVVAVDNDNRIVYVNSAAESLFETGGSHMLGEPLADFVPQDSPAYGLLDQCRQDHCRYSEHGVELDTPRTGPRNMTVQVAPVFDDARWVVLSMHEHSIAKKIGQQLSHRNVARSVTAMARLLAHEVKNPLSGIRGAAQLLEQNAGEEDRTLTRLICDEADRIVALVDRMEAFSDKPQLTRQPVNIHQVLEHVRRVAENGFAKGMRILELYDPSLPPVLGDRDQLIQVFLNLVKNAAEACPQEGGEIVMSTNYQHGIRLAVPGGAANRQHLPLVVQIQDNGPGVPKELRQNLFDPFVTTKSSGSGLGLSLVAKIVDDHGGIIEFDCQPKKTIFRVMLPVA